jgi:hypothetical protein
MAIDETSEAKCTRLIEIASKINDKEDELFMKIMYLADYQRDVAYKQLVPLMFVLFIMFIFKLFKF